MKNYIKVATAVAMCLTALFASSGAIAQKAYVTGGKVYLDLGPDSGFPQAATTTQSKVQLGTPTNTALFPDLETNGQPGTINATLYRKLEVAQSDVPTNAGWAAAYIYCRDTYPTTGGGTGWRLATQRELQLLWMFRTALVDLGSTAMGTVNYWSATEQSATEACLVTFNANNVAAFYGPKSDVSNKARCVREVM